METPGKIFYKGPDTPSLGASDANDGISFDTATSKFVLGNAVGAAGDPAQLLSNREIKLITFFLQFINTVIDETLKIQPASGAIPFGFRFQDAAFGTDISIGFDTANARIVFRDNVGGRDQFLYSPNGTAIFSLSDGTAFATANAVMSVELENKAVGIGVRVNTNAAFVNLIQLANNLAGAAGAVVQSTSLNVPSVYMGSFGPGYPDAFLQNSVGITTDIGGANFWMNFAARGLNSGGYRWFHQIGAGAATQTMEFLNPGRLGIRVAGPTAALHLPAGTANANGAPFKYTAGVPFQTVNEDGAKNYDGNNEWLTVNDTRYIMAKTLSNTQALNFPDTPAQTHSDLNVGVAGAAVGDVVAIGAPAGAVVAGTCYTGYVSSSNNVTVRLNNYSAVSSGAISGTFRVSIIKY